MVQPANPGPPRKQVFRVGGDIAGCWTPILTASMQCSAVCLFADDCLRIELQSLK